LAIKRRAEVARRAEYLCEYCLIHEDDVGFRHHKSITSLAASTAALPISSIWHMPAFFAIAERGVTSLQSMRKRERLFACLILAATGGLVISASMAGASKADRGRVRDRATFTAECSRENCLSANYCRVWVAIRENYFNSDFYVSWKELKTPDPVGVQISQVG
jgi:hypothetical protein